MDTIYTVIYQQQVFVRHLLYDDTCRCYFCHFPDDKSTLKVSNARDY